MSPAAGSAFRWLTPSQLVGECFRAGTVADLDAVRMRRKTA